MFSKQDIDYLAKQSADEHRSVEAAWISFRLHVLNPTLDPEAVSEFKLAFFAGATHMFSDLVQMMRATKNPPRGAAVANIQCLDRELQDYADDIDCSG
jgi:hypothetical protein